MRVTKKTVEATVRVTLCGATLFSFIFASAELGAFQLPARGTGSGEMCALTAQLEKGSFRQRYIQKIAQVQTGQITPQMSAVEEMYSNVQEASLFSLDDDNSSASNALAANIGVDPLSIDCLGCHDGSSASNVTINLKNDPFRHKRGGMHETASDHPIGMDYARYAGRADDFKPILGRGKMILVNGKVGCLTCHDPFNKERGHLVMSDRGSALCLTCHNK